MNHFRKDSRALPIFVLQIDRVSSAGAAEYTIRRQVASVLRRVAFEIGDGISQSKAFTSTDGTNVDWVYDPLGTLAPVHPSAIADAPSSMRSAIQKLERDMRAAAQEQMGTDVALSVTNCGIPLDASAHAAGAGGALVSREETFQSGRQSARNAMAQLGLTPQAIPVGTKGEPIWPNGVVGSITHAGGVAAAIVAPTPPILAVGIDIELADPVEDQHQAKLICNPEEFIEGLSPSHYLNLRRAKVIFVVKEAVYKLCWPLMRTFIDFHDVRVTLDESRGEFIAKIINPNLPELTNEITGRIILSGGWVAAITCLRC
jgi:4'-phosphopantetheinyl transferase EntD